MIDACFVASSRLWLHQALSNELFDRLDIDGSGYLGLLEFTQFVQVEATATRLFNMSDLDGDGPWG